MDVKITLNGKVVTDSVDADMVLLDFCRKHRCYSVKRGCESGNCGLCTVLLDGKPVLSCSTPVGRANGRKVDTLEGLQEEAKAFTNFFAAQGADQCGFCNPGYIVNIVALLRENPDPTDEEILEYLSGKCIHLLITEFRKFPLRNHDYFRQMRGRTNGRCISVCPFCHSTGQHRKIRGLVPLTYIDNAFHIFGTITATRISLVFLGSFTKSLRSIIPA